ncbi:MAG: histidine kinase N-terminal 7TM domain-containing protein, partial [Bacteroidales bacterium]|nr:histidine kinase N-terminal 7TM domain-containing protein [Bacteroidales bacterium]
MSSQIFLFQLLLIFALICSGQMAFALYTRRSASGALYLSLFMGSAFLWSLGSLMGLTAPTISLDYFWLAFSFLGVTTTTVLFLAFALDYSHNTRWLRWKYFIPISILPLTIQILAWIPETRHLLWEVVETGENIQKFIYSYGWVFWIFYSYSYLLIGYPFHKNRVAVGPPQRD